MQDTFYILGKMKEGEFGGELIEEIVHIQNRPFAYHEVYHLIKDNYVNDCEDQRVQKYVQPDGEVIWFLRGVDDGFDPEVDEWDDALAAFWVVVHKQGHKQSVEDYDRTLHVFHPEREAMWHIVWHKKYHPSGINEHTYIVAPTANDAKEQWERRYGTEGTIIEIEGGPF